MRGIVIALLTTINKSVSKSLLISDGQGKGFTFIMNVGLHSLMNAAFLIQNL